MRFMTMNRVILFRSELDEFSRRDIISPPNVPNPFLILDQMSYGSP